MFDWAEIISEAFPGKTWALVDTTDLNTLLVEKDGVMSPATKAEKKAIRDIEPEITPILEQRKARRRKMKAAIGELNHDKIYEILLDDKKLDRLKAKAREIEGG